MALPLVPLTYLVVRGGGAGADAWRATLEGGLVGIAARSLLLAGLVAVGTVLIAVPWAFLVVRSDLPARRVWGLVGALPLVVPSYVGAFALVGAFGPRGMLQGMLEPLGVARLPEIYGFGGALAVLVLFTYPYVLLLVSAAWRRTDTSLERAARGMGRTPWQAFRVATLPQLRSSIVAGGLLSALYALGDFGVVSIMRVDTFTRQIYLRYGALFDREGAAILGLVLCALTFGVILLERRVLRGDQRGARERINARDSLAVVALGPWKWPALVFVTTVSAFALVVPLAVLAWWLGTLGVDGEWGARLTETLAAMGGSLLASSLGAAVAAALAVPVALLLVRAPGRLPSTVEAIVYSGYALPGLVAALGLTFFATRTAFWLYQTLALLVVAYVIRFLPQAVGATRAALERVNPTLESAARGMGMGPWRAFRSVTLRLAGPGILAGAMLVFLTAMKELPATLVLRPTGYETLATQVWSDTNVSDYAEAALPALVLVAISAIPLWLLVIRPVAGTLDDASARGDVAPPTDSGAGD
ncbi:MAG: binding-protein-dependent transport system inner rane component [Thermoleophilia bacterium]|nr:binding-protein-dependent transport system inner rane component [Thermoleophilia bacterium]